MRRRLRNVQRLLAVVATLSATAVAGVSLGASAAQAAPAEGNVRGTTVPGTVSNQYIVVLRPGTADTKPADTKAADTKAADTSAADAKAADPGTAEPAAAALARRYGGTVRRSYRSAVHGFSATLTASAAKRLAADPAVAYVEQDRKVRLSQADPPSWGLDRVDQVSLPLNAVYNYPNTASNVHAYIIDTGVRISHTDFGGRASNGYDFIDNDTVANDCYGHGTHVAGTVGGTRYGVAKGVKLVAVRVLGCDGMGDYSQIIAGVDWVTRHAIKPAVANMSIGGSAGSTLDNAVKASIASGVTYAVAAGNDHADACLSSPARLAEAITVGATTATDQRASFSNYGTCLDIFAPGENIRSTYNTSNTATALMSGTSMATPHVTGAAALVLSANPTATPAQIRNTLVSKATTGKIHNVGVGSPNRLLRVVATAIAATTCTRVSTGTDLTVPDLATVTSTLTVACAGKASPATKIEIHVRHPHAGDLTITLIAPDGTGYPLRLANPLSAVAGITATYTVNASSENRSGGWRLRISDTHAGHIGYLDSWVLTV
jgi:subtilisin family serine protease